MSDRKKLRKFLEGLEVQQIDELMEKSPEEFYEFGKLMKSKILELNPLLKLLYKAKEDV